MCLSTTNLITMTLLQDAKKHSKDTRGWAEITNEHVELSLALLKGDVTLGGIAKALKMRNGSQQVYTTMTRALIKAYEQKKIKII